MFKRKLLLSSALAVAVTAGFAGYVSGAVGVNSKPLRTALTVPNIRLHQAALQAIADANGGERASGFPGFNASAASRVDFT